MRPTMLVLLAGCLWIAAAGAAGAARLPGVRTPSRNIGCFYVPQRPTAHGRLLCSIQHAGYTGALQQRCIAPPVGLDWHGFALAEAKRAEVVCAGGIMYDARDTPSYAILAYGRTWRYRGFTCTSRRAGLTCTDRARHGLFLSRESWRAW